MPHTADTTADLYCICGKISHPSCGLEPGIVSLTFNRNQTLYAHDLVRHELVKHEVLSNISSIHNKAGVVPSYCYCRDWKRLNVYYLYVLYIIAWRDRRSFLVVLRLMIILKLFCSSNVSDLIFYLHKMSLFN